MPHEILVALDVADAPSYQHYREAMTPLLEAAGGGFRYDFEIARTLRSEAAHPITRLFAIHFPDRAARESFFADPRYQAAREQWFVPSVKGVTIVAEYDR